MSSAESSPPTLDSAAARAYRQTPLPDPSTPWREAAFSVIDFELTGLDPSSNEIISLASVTVENGCVKPGETIYRLVRPRHMPGPETIRIHGLRESDLAHAPPLSELLDELLEALTGRALVAHVAAIETSFLGDALTERGLEVRNPVIDTAKLALELRRLRRQTPLIPGRWETTLSTDSSPGLNELARSLKLPVHRPHHADGDALTTAQVFLALATHLDANEPQTVGSLARISGHQAARFGSVRRSLKRLMRGGRS